MSHSTLRAKRAIFTFWVGKSCLKMPKMVNFGDFLKTWSLWSNSVTRQITFNWTKIDGKCQNSNIQMRHLGWFSNIVHPADLFENQIFLIFDETFCWFSNTVKLSDAIWTIFWKFSPFVSHPPLMIDQMTTKSSWTKNVVNKLS